MKLFSKIFNRKPKFLLQNDYIIQEAFTCGGVTYYCFDDTFNQPFERALTALDFYDELRMRTEKDFLKLHTVATDDLLSNPKRIDVGQLSILNKQLKERLDWIIAPDLVYKLASVIFFDKTESPYKYDHKYAKNKIKKWKKSEDVNAFFLREPIQKLVPFLNGLEIDFQAYSTMVKKITAVQLENIFTSLSDETKNSDYVKKLISQMAIHQD